MARGADFGKAQTHVEWYVTEKVKDFAQLLTLLIDTPKVENGERLWAIVKMEWSSLNELIILASSSSQGYETSDAAKRAGLDWSVIQHRVKVMQAVYENLPVGC